MKYILLLFLLNIHAVIYCQNFQELDDIPFTGVKDGTLIFFDMDGDSDNDLLISGENSTGSGIIQLYANDGKGNFTEMTNSLPQGIYHCHIATNDFDLDGDIDIVLAGILRDNLNEEKIMQLYTNNGLGDFTKEVNSLPEYGSGPILLEDVDGNSLPDILVSDFFSSFPVVLFKQISLAEFDTLSWYSDLNYEQHTMALADMDNDTYPDLLISGTSKRGVNYTHLYKNDGSGIFNLKPEATSNGVNYGLLAIADVDKDGDFDYFISGSYADPNSPLGLSVKEAKMLINDGNANFTVSKNNPFHPVDEGEAVFADIDGDSDMDLLVCGSYTTNIYINEEGIFEKMKDLKMIGLSQAAVAIADVDGDGDPDVLISGDDDQNCVIKLYLNNSK